MEGVSLIGFLVVGLIAGWLGGKIIRGGGFGFFGNLIVGIVGVFVGGFLFNSLGIAGLGFVGALVTATGGAFVLLFIVGLIKRGCREEATALLFRPRSRVASPQR